MARTFNRRLSRKWRSEDSDGYRLCTHIALLPALRLRAANYLVAARRLHSAPRRQAQVDRDGEMFASHDVEVGWSRIILARTRPRSGEVGNFYQGPGALNAREVLAHAGRLAMLVLNHRRPVGADHRLHQLGEIFAEQFRRSGNPARIGLAPTQGCGLVENKCRFL